MKSWIERFPLLEFLWKSKLAKGMGGIVILLAIMPLVIEFPDYASNVWPEILSIGFGVFLIDGSRDFQDKKRYKESLKRQARSRSNSNAVDAIEIIRVEGWLLEKSIRLLGGADLRKADLSKADLRTAYLQETWLHETKLYETDMRGAILTDAKFVGAQLCETKFTGANLLGSDFTDATLKRCLFKIDHETDDTGDAILSNSEKRVIFEKAMLESITFLGMNLGYISFINATTNDIIFNCAYLKEADFTDAEFIKTRFVEANLERARFIGAKTQNIISFKEANLRLAQLEECTFQRTDFNKADLTRANCRKVTFSDSNLWGVNFTDAILIGTSFIRVEFDGETILPNGKSLKDLWDEYASNQEGLSIEDLFRKQVPIYLFEEFNIEDIHDSHFVWTEDKEIKLDIQESRARPNPDLLPSKVDHELTANE